MTDWTCTAEEYHADVERVSHSALEVFRKSRRLYHHRFVAQTMPAPEPSDAMRFGTLLHCLVLEPNECANRFAVAPVCDRRTKAGKEMFASFMDFSAGKEVIDAESAELAKRCADAVMSNKIAREWLEYPGKHEHAIRWQDHETGLMCKSRRDRVLPHAIIDLKTCRDASPAAFARSAATFGYFRQAAWYLDGEKASGGTAEHFLFIAVSTEPPHEVACYEPDPSDVADARVENRKLLMKLADCLEHDDWLGPHEKRQTMLRLPRWVNFQNEYEVSE